MGPATAAPGGKGNIMKKAFSIIALIVALSMLAACGAGSAEPTPTPEPTPTATPEPTPEPTPTATPEPTPEPLPHLDYANAEAFEAALNAGENLTGKTVRFVVTKFIPKSFFGYNLVGGQHLNFCSPHNPDAEVGQELTVVVQDVVSTMGSWIISYEFTEAEADENTIA